MVSCYLFRNLHTAGSAEHSAAVGTMLALGGPQAVQGPIDPDADFNQFPSISQDERSAGQALE